LHCEATVNSTTNTTPTIVPRRSRSALTWVDFLVIVAIVITFAAIVSTTVGRARASTYNTTTPGLTEISEAHMDSGLIKARLRLATGGPWN
jgi:hypothetical protein